MKEKPILFNGAMVRAILSGAKTQTRRMVKPQPRNDPSKHHPIKPYKTSLGDWNWVLAATGMGTGDPFPCPFGQPGDRLWVRETFAIQCNVEDEDPPHSDGRPVQYRLGAESGFRWSQAHYRATDPAADLTCDVYGCAQCRDHDMGPHWRPSIHMPRWACRLVLEITEVRVERLQAISEADALAEGIEEINGRFTHNGGTSECRSPWGAFAQLWDSTGGDWDSNPWVWVITFKRIDA